MSRNVLENYERCLDNSYYLRLLLLPTPTPPPTRTTTTTTNNNNNKSAKTVEMSPLAMSQTFLQNSKEFVEMSRKYL